MKDGKNLRGLTAGEETPPLRRQHDGILLLDVNALQILLTGPLQIYITQLINLEVMWWR
jgi:hypothetical protein